MNITGTDSYSAELTYVRSKLIKIVLEMSVGSQLGLQYARKRKCNDER